MIQLDLDVAEVKRLVASLEASPKQIRQSMNRALRRTAGTLRVRASKGLVPELQLRRAGDLRKRLRALKLSAKGDMSEIAIWFGLNDLPVRSFKGRVKEYAGGASIGNHEFPGAFVARRKGGPRSIFKRSGGGRFPIAEQTINIKEQADVFLEDVIFPDAIGIFMKNFSADLKARTLFGDASWDRKGAK